MEKICFTTTYFTFLKKRKFSTNVHSNYHQINHIIWTTNVVKLFITTTPSGPTKCGKIIVSQLLISHFPKTCTHNSNMKTFITKFNKPSGVQMLQDCHKHILQSYTWWTTDRWTLCTNYNKYCHWNNIWYKNQNNFVQSGVCHLSMITWRQKGSYFLCYTEIIQIYHFFVMQIFSCFTRIYKKGQDFSIDPGRKHLYVPLL